MSHIEEDIDYGNEIIATDRDKLISMLDEYSAKLNRNIIDRERKKSLPLLCSILLFCLVGILTFTRFFVSEVINNHSDSITNESVIYIALAWSSIVSVVSGGLAFYFGYRGSSVTTIFPHDNMKNVPEIYTETSETNNYTYDIHSLAYRLEKLVRMASQFYEHVETNQIDKMNLDFKLAAAESVLKYYESTIGQPKTPKSG
jgi:hypothetical protein